MVKMVVNRGLAVKPSRYVKPDTFAYYSVVCERKSCGVANDTDPSKGCRSLFGFGHFVRGFFFVIAVVLFDGLLLERLARFDIYGCLNVISGCGIIIIATSVKNGSIKKNMFWVY